MRLSHYELFNIYEMKCINIVKQQQKQNKTKKKRKNKPPNDAKAFLSYKAWPFDNERGKREKGAGHEVNRTAVVNLWCQIVNMGFFGDFIAFLPFVCAADLKNTHTLLMPCFQHVAFSMVMCHKYTFIQGAQ